MTNDQIFGTTNAITKTAAMMTKMAGEAVSVEYIGGAYYAFGSEIATLRLFHSYNKAAHNPKASAGFSENLKKFYFRLEV